MSLFFGVFGMKKFQFLDYRLRQIIFGFVISSMCLFFASDAKSDQPTSRFDPDIVGANIEQLLSLTVTSVSKIPESAHRASAAISVLTSDDIRRSGARSIPEVLRLVPGVQVARIDANKWAVSVRGFNSRTANKLLVMIDGRSIYNPLFSGTLWETKDVFLEDVERIEVIRGPGGSTWGSNAVNGVINIITKGAQYTQGGLVILGGGTEERSFQNFRYGSKLSNTGFLRVFGKYYQRDDGQLSDSITEEVSDDSHSGMGGFRFDEVQQDQTFTLQGSYDRGNYDGVSHFQNMKSRDLVLQGQWNRRMSKGSTFLLNGYFARTDFQSPLASEDRGTGEINIQYSYMPIDWATFLTGVQYKVTSDEVTNSDILSLHPTDRTDNLFGTFLHGRFDLLPRSLELRTGARLERNDYTDIELQPEIALSWTPTENDVWWTSVSHADRTPSRLENDFLFSIPTNGTVFTGNRTLGSEGLNAYQIGYRRTFSNTFLLDTAAFYHAYEDLIIAEQSTLTNGAKGDTYGVEISPTWQFQNWGKVTAGYSFLLSDFELKSGSSSNEESTLSSLEGNSPQHQVFARTSLNLIPGWEMDFGVRYVDQLSAPKVSPYVVGDVRVAWKATQKLDLSIVGQNLFRAQHFEQGSASSSQVGQGVYGQLTWEF
jgi:iron complex outermembrane recepter protein